MKNKTIVAKTVLVMIIAVAILAGIFYFEMSEYEKGIIDVYSTQQDSYVQLVLDQINIKENRDDEEIINSILASLDASTNKYWTFSKAQSLLFVKDVLETNKFKGFTDESYYASEDAREFLESLTVNKVIHRNVTIDNKEYVASGVSFEYNNSEYKLCLLTNRNILLDNNSFLGAKVALCTVIGLILVCTFLFGAYSAHRYQKAKIEADKCRNDLDTSRKTIEELNEALREKHSLDTKQKIWSEDMLPEFLDRMSKRGVTPVAVVAVKCADTGARHEFLAGISITADESVVRFDWADNGILLLGIRMNSKLLKTAIRPSMSAGCEVAGSMDLTTPEDMTLLKVREGLKG